MTKRMPLISGNWKMHHNHFEAIQFVQKLSYLINKDDYANVDVSVHPPFTDLRSVQTLLDVDQIPIALGAQHCHWEDKGAFTGEVSPSMLVKLAVSYVIVGHSERRWVFGETDQVVAKKARAVFAHDMVPIVCVGEKLEERDAGRTADVVEGQVKAALGGLDPANAARLVIAYEPVWAIGTGRNANPADAGEVISLIRRTVDGLFGGQTGQAVRVQYGGSVKAGNIREFMAHPEIDGALVGGASLDPEEFALIVKYQ